MEYQDDRSCGIKVSLLNRAKSFIVIMIAGILFLVVLLAEGGLDLIRQNSNISISGTSGNRRNDP